MRFHSLLPFALLLAAVGCDDTSTTDAAADAPVDLAADAPGDVAPDSPPDAPADITSDASNDASPDVAADVAADARPDASPDVAADASPDVAADVAPDAAPDAAAGSCGASTCMPSELCVRQRTLGGAFLPPDDAGTCPPGRHVEGSACVADFAYRCAVRPPCAAVDCACLGMVCPSSFMCRGAEAAQVTCEQLAP